MSGKFLAQVALAICLLASVAPRAVAGQSDPRSAWLSFESAVYGARSIFDITPYLVHVEEQRMRTTSKEQQESRLSWFKYYYVYNIHVDSVAEDGDQAELSATCDWSDKNGRKFRVQVFVNEIKEDDKWKVEYKRVDVIRSPFVR
jgi:hypothetical protein